MIKFATRYPEAIPLQRIDATTDAESLCEVFTRLGLPEELLSDQGSNFTSNLMKLIFSTSWEAHLQHLKQVCQQLETAGLKVKARKCSQAMEEYTYLGHARCWKRGYHIRGCMPKLLPLKNLSNQKQRKM